MKTIDLHTHSLCSDGAQVPSEVVRTAYDAGLAATHPSQSDQHFQPFLKMKNNKKNEVKNKPKTIPENDLDQAR